MRHTRKLVCLIALCLAALASMTFTINPHAAVTHNRLATNKLATNRLATNRLATNRLATNALTSTKLEANMATADLLSTADGRDVYAYLVNCALPAGTTLQATLSDAPDTTPPATLYTCGSGLCIFPGGIGLAEYWIDHKLDPKGALDQCLHVRSRQRARYGRADLDAWSS